MQNSKIKTNKRYIYYLIKFNNNNSNKEQLLKYLMKIIIRMKWKNFPNITQINTFLIV